MNEKDKKWPEKYETDDMNNGFFEVYHAGIEALEGKKFVAFDLLYTDRLGGVLSEFYEHGYTPFEIHSSELGDGRVYWRVVLQRED